MFVNININILAFMSEITKEKFVRRKIKNTYVVHIDPTTVGYHKPTVYNIRMEVWCMVIYFLYNFKKVMF